VAQRVDVGLTIKKSRVPLPVGARLHNVSGKVVYTLEAVQLKPNSITLASSELAPNMFGAGASSQPASVMEFGF